MTVCYVFDARHSRFTVQAFAAGMLSVFAHSPNFAIRDFTGEFQFTPDTVAPGTLTITVKSDSLELLDAVKPVDRQEIDSRMRSEVLDIGAYPEIRFQCGGIAADKIAENWYRLQLKGNLTLHGVTAPHSIQAQFRIMDDEIRLSGEFKLLQSAYRIKRVTAVAGAITIKDELRFSFELVGKKQDA
jgi:polyisoprenoid-binding protein YceI